MPSRAAQRAARAVGGDHVARLARVRTAPVRTSRSVGAAAPRSAGDLGAEQHAVRGDARRQQQRLDVVLRDAGGLDRAEHAALRAARVADRRSRRPPAAAASVSASSIVQVDVGAALAHGVLQPPAAHQLHRAQAEHGGARVRGQDAAALDEQARDVVARELDRGGEAGRAGAGDQDGGRRAWRAIVRRAAGARAHEQRLLNRRAVRSDSAHAVAARRARSRARVRRRGAGGRLGRRRRGRPARPASARRGSPPRPRRARARGRAVEWVRATRSARPRSRSARSRRCCRRRALPEGVELLARARDALAAARGRAPAGAVRRRRAAARRRLGRARPPARGRRRGVRARHRAARRAGAGRAARAVEGRAVRRCSSCGALARDEVEALLAAGARRPGRRRAASSALWELTRGNALFLRELVRHGVDRGLLAEDGGVWRWRGALEAGTRLAQLVDLRIEDVGAARTRACWSWSPSAAPLELDLLGPTSLEALERARARGAPHRRGGGGSRTSRIRCTARRCARGSRRRALDAIRTRLADAVEARGARRGGDLLRVADVAARRRRGRRRRAVHARGRARRWRRSTRRSAERLARAAVQAERRLRRPAGARPARSPRPAAAPRRRAAARRARAGGARRRCASARSRWRRARNLFWALDRAADADAVLRTAERRVRRRRPLRHELAAQRVRLTAADGRPQAALAAARAAAATTRAVDERARIDRRAGRGRGAALVRARPTRRSRWPRRGCRSRGAASDELPHAEAVLLGMRALALRLAGRLAEATTESAAAPTSCFAPGGRRPATAVEANIARPDLARARPRRGRRCASAARAPRCCATATPSGMLAFALAGVAQAAAQAGDAGRGAQRAVAELERTPLGHKGFAVELGAGARLERRGGRRALARAGARPRRGRRSPRARGQDAYAVRALHDALPARRPGRRRARARASSPAGRRPVRRGRGRARRGARRRRRRRAARGRRALRRARRAARRRRGGRRRGRRPPRRRPAGRAPAPPPRAPALWLTQCEGARPPTLLGAPEAAEPDAARARDRAARRRRVEQPRDRRRASCLRAHRRQPPAERVPQARRDAPAGPPRVLTATPRPGFGAVRR